MNTTKWIWRLVKHYTQDQQNEPATSALLGHRWQSVFSHKLLCCVCGDAENAGLENAGLENVGPNRRGGKRGTGKRGTKSHGWKTQDWKTEDQFCRGGKRGTGKHGNIICMDSQT